MSGCFKRIISVYASVFGAVAPFTAHHAFATEFTAGVIMEKMDTNERFPYVAGVIEGLAYARYRRDNENVESDKKSVEGMKCIYNWFYEKKGTIDLIYIAFGRYPTYTPGVIIGNLVRKDCGN